MIGSSEEDGRRVETAKVGGDGTTKHRKVPQPLSCAELNFFIRKVSLKLIKPNGASLKRSRMRGIIGDKCVRRQLIESISQRGTC